MMCPREIPGRMGGWLKVNHQDKKEEARTKAE